MVYYSGICICWYAGHEAQGVVRLMRLALLFAILCYSSAMVVYCGVYAIICYGNAMVHYSGFCIWWYSAHEAQGVVRLMRLAL